MASFLERFLPGSSSDVLRLRGDIARLNEPSNLSLVRTVLIVGESGAGKTHIARVLAAHRVSLQPDGDPFENNLVLDSYLADFDEVNLPNLPEQLIESELFGYKPGAFTDAKKEKFGLLSSEGTTTKTDILLDEIGDASAVLQSKLLQVAESGRFRPLGAPPGDDELTQARLIFATNHNLEDDVREGRFREDLYWRLNNIRIEVPPLRRQRDQIPALIEGIVRLLLVKLNDAGFPSEQLLQTLSHEDINWACDYGWPGNVRQLRNAIERWVVHGGKKSFRDVTLENNAEIFRTSTFTSSSALVDRLNGRDVLGGLSKVVDDVQRQAKREILDWFDRTHPSAEELGRRFPDMQVRSVRQKLSDWRRELRRD